MKPCREYCVHTEVCAYKNQFKALAQHIYQDNSYNLDIPTHELNIFSLELRCPFCLPKHSDAVFAQDFWAVKRMMEDQ